MVTGVTCPKHMVFGPCGGVRADGSCEIGGPCAFVGPGAVVAPAVPVATVALPTAAAEQLRSLMERRQIVVVDLPSAGPDADLERRLASTLAGHVDAALLGDAPWARLQFPPAVRAGLVAQQGLRPWCGLNCRDRNRVALRAELAALAATGVGAVHCVTGDYPQRTRDRSVGDPAWVEPDGAMGVGARGAADGPRGAADGATGDPEHGADGDPARHSVRDATAVFDLDSTQLATSAAATGLVVSVAESPSAPPVDGRPARAAAKAAAGADVCFVNHTGSRDDLARFVAETRALAPGLRIVVCVGMVLSQGGARRLAEFFPGSLPPSVTEALASPDPGAAAISAAVRAATEILAIDGVDGVDLSAPPAPGEELAVAGALATVGQALGGGA